MIVPRPEPSPIVAPPVGGERATVKVSLGSRSVSPTTLTVIVFEVSPLAKLTVPVSVPVTSEASAPPAPPGKLTVQVAPTAPSEPPVRLTVKVKAVVPALPSASVTSLIASVPGTGATSSLVIVPWPWASPTVAPVTLVTLTKKVSLGSVVRSPLTVTLNE